MKVAPLIRTIKKHNASSRGNSITPILVHTGQHYDYEMSEIFFQDLELPKPDIHLGIGSGTHAEEVGKMLIGIERILLEENPDVVLVEGDTNSVLAGALAAAKLHIKVGHVEAGLRSYDRNMPEELNRVLTDHLADYLFAPTEKTKRILLGEGITEGNIFVTGNSIVDAIYQNLEFAKEKSKILDKLGLNKGEYFLVTVHRQENVEVKDRLKGILQGLRLV